MKLNLAIIDDNQLYLHRIMKAFEKYTDFSIHFFDNVETLKKITSKKYDAILIKNELFDKNEFSLDICNLWVLTSEDGLTEISDDNIISILKYQPTINIRNKIISEYASRCEQKNILNYNTNSTKFIAIYSPIGGSGKTTVAKSICKKLSNMNYSTMYLNFEDISSQERVSQTNKKSLSANQYIEDEDLFDESSYLGGSDFNDVFSIMSKNKDVISFMDGIKHIDNDGTIYFNPFTTIYDVYDISENDISQLMKYIKNSNMAKYVIIDLGSSLTNTIRKILDLVDNVIIVETNGYFHQEKLSKFEYFYDYQQYHDKFFSIGNFGFKDSFKFDSIGTLQSVSANNIEEYLSTLSSYIDVQIIL